MSAQHNPSGVASGPSAVSVVGTDYKEPREQSGNPSGVASGSSAVSVAGADYKEPREQSGNPYIDKVYEYCPAPGQFVNELPEYEIGDDAESMRLKAEECIANHEQTVISLGGWGGYVVFGFDHFVPNFKGEYDIKILGNAFYSNSATGDPTAIGGNAEPGIVMVSFDANHNGQPDDPWYELAGSEYTNPATRHGYSCTYYRDKDNSDTIRWADNSGGTGRIAKNPFHTQDYYPLWIEDDQLTFTGTRLRDNGIDESGEGKYYVLYCFDWGYADNHPNQYDDKDRHVSEFKIDWAVDSNGNHVDLPGINFVKVYTGVNQHNGWLGEASTEIMDAWDLHLVDADGNDLTLGIESTEQKNDSRYPFYEAQSIYDLYGRKISESGSQTSNRKGIYIVNGKKISM